MSECKPLAVGRIAARLNLPEDVAGATLLALGGEAVQVDPMKPVLKAPG
jgi:hypothetical protein